MYNAVLGRLDPCAQRLEHRLWPIFALRDHYYLLNHGALTEVSRSEYVLNGASLQVGWHSLLELVSLVMWKQFVYGRSS